MPAGLHGKPLTPLGTCGTNSPQISSFCQREQQEEVGMEGYCVKCKDKREMKDAKELTMKNGRKAAKGKCTACGTSMFKILGNK